MRRLVDGEEIEFPGLHLRTTQLADRLLVHTEDGTFSALVVRSGDAVLVSYRGRQYRVERPGLGRSAAAGSGSGEIRAPMPGTVVSVNVKEGDEVEKGTTILVIEAMKTQQPFVAPFEAVVEKLHVAAGQNVSDGSLLAILRLSTDNHERVSE